MLILGRFDMSLGPSCGPIGLFEPEPEPVDTAGNLQSCCEYLSFTAATGVMTFFVILH